VTVELLGSLIGRIDFIKEVYPHYAENRIDKEYPTSLKILLSLGFVE
jgi:hypothetical protein